jgi:hypothetical protein
MTINHYLQLCVSIVILIKNHNFKLKLFWWIFFNYKGLKSTMTSWAWQSCVDSLSTFINLVENHFWLYLTKNMDLIVGGKKQKKTKFITSICVLVHLAIFHQVLSELGQIYHGESDWPFNEQRSFVRNKWIH